MGAEVLVTLSTDPALDMVLGRLRAAGLPSTVVMIDGALCAPQSPVPPAWRDLRLRTPAGVVTLARRLTGVAVVTFGNADAALQAAQQAIVRALAEV